MDAYLDRAIAALKQKQWEVAEEALLTLLAEAPNHPQGSQLMAQMAFQAGYPEDAHDLLLRAFGAHPDNRALGKSLATVEIHLGQIALQKNQCARATDLLRSAIDHDPEGVNHVILGQLATALLRNGFPDEAREVYRKRLRFLPNDPMAWTQWVGLISGDPAVSARDLIQAGCEWDERFGRPARDRVVPPTHANRGRPRIGFLSTTFFNHANCKFLLPLLQNLDPRKFEVFAFHDGKREDDVSERVKAAVTHFVSLKGLSPSAAAGIIAKRELDLLVDINGYFDDNRLQILCHRPAPVQAHYLGGAGPTSLSCVDWWLVDDLVVDAREATQTVEKVFFLEGGMHAFEPLHPTAALNHPPYVRNGFISFGCFNSLTKFEDPVLKFQGEVLRAFPESRLLLVKDIFADQDSATRFLERAAKLGLPVEQLDLRASSENCSFGDLSVYHHIDIALDTFPYNGVTTTCEALWMGVPVITLEGSRFVGNEAGAILSRLGHSEWIARDSGHAVQIIRKMAEEPALLGDLRSGLRNRFSQSTLANGKRLAKAFEEFIRTALR